MRTPADQYASLMQSVTVADKLVQRFKLTGVYQVSMKTLARQKLEQATRIAVGKKDGLISVEVDDTDPARAADVANAYVEELRQSLSTIAVTEAQQRRAFFEIELKASRDRLTKAQLTLQGSGFNASSLRAEPKAAAEGYAKLKAEVTSAEVRLQTLRSTLVDSTPEVQRQVAQLSALRSQLAKLEQFSDGSSDADYLGKYREFKYQEALFELFARQYEMARLDESREGPLLQVVDKAMPPELRSKPRRAITAVVVTLCTAAILMTLLSIRGYWRQRARNPAVRQKLSQLKAAIRD
jgi:capsule polysaccharide export protein KpsE/RkpR